MINIDSVLYDKYNLLKIIFLRHTVYITHLQILEARLGKGKMKR